MGIGRGAYRLLLEEKKRGAFSGGSVLQLGRQCILFDAQLLQKYALLHQVPLRKIEPQLSFDSHYRKLGFIDDHTLFKSLGFQEVKSLDFSNFEGADLVWDLNQTIPEEYWGKFDLIYDGGTAEHVFHFPQVLKNIHLLLKEGGIVIHVSPSHNHVDHGFYMFSPQVYSEYYRSNRYSILTSHFFEYSPDHQKPWTIYAYEPGVLDQLAYGGFGKKMVAIHLVAKKTAESTSGVSPNQGGYLSAWAASAKPVEKNKRVDPITRLGISLRKKIRRRMPLWIKWHLARKKLKKIAEL